MKIWGARTGGNPVRVAIFLAEKGIEIPFEPVDLLKGAHKQPDFLAKNPTGHVPVLELDDGTCISETMAICRYFERLHPQPPLMGIDSLDEAIIEMWQRRVEFNFYAPVRDVFRHSVPFVKALEPVQLADWAELNRPRVTAALEMLDAQLQRERFIAGANFTVADITAIMADQMSGRIEYPAPSQLTAYSRWRDEVLRRPSVISVFGAPKT